MDLIRSLMPLFLSIIEMVLESLSGKMDFPKFQFQLQAKLNEIGRTITQQVLEELDRQIRADKAKRRGWQVFRRGDKKEIITCFGAVTFERTYYRHAKTKEYVYLVDEQAGYRAHMRVDTMTKAKLAAKAADLSYRKSASAVAAECGGVSLSGQTVLKAVREFEFPKPPHGQVRKKVKTLYIEADEDHVACQHGRSMEARLVYIHEGWQTTGIRRKLIHPFYISSMDEKAETFWERVCQEVEARYDWDALENIYLLGDGAAWIQEGLEEFPNAEFVLDRFHLMKAIRRAVGGKHSAGRALRMALCFGHSDTARSVMQSLMEQASTESRKQAIRDVWKYIWNNWDGIQALYRTKQISCSAEGHISHVLSTRLSSRPMGWSRNGAKHMAYIRTYQANGGSVTEEYVRQQRDRVLPVLMIAEETRAKQRKGLKKACDVLDNIPVLQGSKSFLFEALRGLSSALA